MAANVYTARELCLKRGDLVLVRYGSGSSGSPLRVLEPRDPKGTYREPINNTPGTLFEVEGGASVSRKEVRFYIEDARCFVRAN